MGKYVVVVMQTNRVQVGRRGLGGVPKSNLQYPLYTFVGNDKDALIENAKSSAEGYLRSYPNVTYQILLGELTHKVSTPKVEYRLEEVK